MGKEGENRGVKQGSWAWPGLGRMKVRRWGKRWKEGFLGRTAQGSLELEPPPA